MGCIASKRSTRDPPVSPLQRSNSDGSLHRQRHWNLSRKLKFRSHVSPNSPSALGEVADKRHDCADNDGNSEKDGGVGKIKKKLKSSKSRNSSSSFSLSFKIGAIKNQVTAENCAAGWPDWLSGVAAEAVQGWLPLRADSYEKLEKIGQGTYSSVFRARENATGKIFALKKVRFDNLQPESVRFMSREITILRRLDHPNIMKLHGLITSKASCSLYLVFDYMEHDLAGLVSCPEIKFAEPQIKCFMQQLLHGLEYCHHQGVMHRDIKTSNILLNDDGVLKIADFGLANFISARYKQPLTSRVVTLWYRPPELLLGSTNYGAYVDLWSVGCVFAELLVGRPILKGKTEVEQLHKIFKLCGSPPADFWTKSTLPHTTSFRPQASYESSLRERFREFPETSVNLLETLLSVTPQNRGTAASLLVSEYFTTEPYACEPSSLPKYPPNKEMDAKSREEARRKRMNTVQDSSSAKLPRRKAVADPTSFSMLGRANDESQTNSEDAQRNSTNVHVSGDKKADDMRSVDGKSEVSGTSPGGSASMSSFSGFVLQKRKHDDGTTSTPTRASSVCDSSRTPSLDPSSVLHVDELSNSQQDEFKHNGEDDAKSKGQIELEMLPDN